MIIPFVLESNKLIPLLVGSVKKMHLIPRLREDTRLAPWLQCCTGHALSSRFITQHDTRNMFKMKELFSFFYFALKKKHTDFTEAQIHFPARKERVCSAWSN